MLDSFAIRQVSFAIRQGFFAIKQSVAIRQGVFAIKWVGTAQMKNAGLVCH